MTFSFRFFHLPLCQVWGWHFSKVSKGKSSRNSIARQGVEREVGNCFNIQIPGWGFPPVPSQLFYHSQAFELFTFWCSDVLVLETGISQSLWLQPDGQDSLKFQPHKVSFIHFYFVIFDDFKKMFLRPQYYLSGFGSSASLFW